jgi:MerR family transcriptional regulator, light-induced transcriptional regulator
MATVFGISGLKSRLDGWRASWRTREAEGPAITDGEAADISALSPLERDRHVTLLVEDLVIPRLLAGTRTDAVAPRSAASPPADCAEKSSVFCDADVATFARLSLGTDTCALIAFVDRALDNGSSVERIYVDLLAPAARLLGTYWEEDSEDFVAVTMGLWRIQEVLRDLTARIPPPAQSGFGRRSALFSPMPGEQHSFGSLMVSECFQRAGWDTQTLIEPKLAELTSAVAKSSFDLIGLTVSCDCPSGALTGLISTLRAISANPHIRIMIGGRVVNDRPSLVAECGADGTAIDAEAAVRFANRLVPARVERFETLI